MTTETATDMTDIRYNRDLKKDTLLAIKLVYRTQEKLKELHPKAMDAVRAMGIL